MHKIIIFRFTFIFYSKKNWLSNSWPWVEVFFHINALENLHLQHFHSQNDHYGYNDCGQIICNIDFAFFGHCHKHKDTHTQTPNMHLSFSFCLTHKDFFCMLHRTQKKSVSNMQMSKSASHHIFHEMLFHMQLIINLNICAEHASLQQKKLYSSKHFPLSLLDIIIAINVRTFFHELSKALAIARSWLSLKQL